MMQFFSSSLLTCCPHVRSQHLKGAASGTEAVATVTAVPLQYKETCVRAHASQGQN